MATEGAEEATQREVWWLAHSRSLDDDDDDDKERTMEERTALDGARLTVAEPMGDEPDAVVCVSITDGYDDEAWVDLSREDATWLRDQLEDWLGQGRAR